MKLSLPGYISLFNIVIISVLLIISLINQLWYATAVNICLILVNIGSALKGRLYDEVHFD